MIGLRSFVSGTLRASIHHAGRIERLDPGELASKVGLRGRFGKETSGA